MKKIIALLLVLVMVMAMAACGNETENKVDNGENNQVETNQPETNEGEGEENKEEVPATNGALVILETIWNSYAEDEKFFINGGDTQGHIEKMEADENYQPPMAPGVYNLEYAEDLSGAFVIPADDVANADEAATMTHGMNANNFSCAALHLKDGTDVAAFAENVKTAMKSNQWICGQPETLLVVSFGDGYVLVAFGVNDAMGPFETKLTGAYESAEILVKESLI